MCSSSEEGSYSRLIDLSNKELVAEAACKRYPGGNGLSLNATDPRASRSLLSSKDLLKTPHTLVSLCAAEAQIPTPRKALRGGISKTTLHRPCQFLAINAHKMAPETTQWLQDRTWDTPTKGLLWIPTLSERESVQAFDSNAP